MPAVDPPGGIRIVSKRLRSLRKLQVGASVSVARNESAEIPLALYEEIAPLIEDRLLEKGYKLTALRKADLFLVFDVGTEEVRGCVTNATGEVGYVGFHYKRLVVSKKNVWVYHNFSIKVDLEDPNTVCPNASYMRRKDLPCPIECEYDAYVHYATVRVYDAAAFRNEGRERLLWDGVALLGDVGTMDPFDDASVASVATQLVAAAFNEFPRTFESKTEEP
jgi:hypothetical protein